jgi:hypothetical protein
MALLQFRRFGAAASVALLQACAGFVPQPGPGPEAPGRYVQLTTPMVAVADTQEHESTGYPLHDNDNAIDAYVEVAQRPPEQPLFGRRVLQWALKSHPNEPFLHLGDVMDVSCRSEAERMTRTLEEGGRAGAVLPGNHDGLMFGIYNYSILEAVLDPGSQRWHKACRRGASLDDTRYKTEGEALSKRDFISRYIASHAANEATARGLVVPPARGEQSLSWRNPDEQAFLSAIEAHLLDGLNYAESFIAQRLLLPRAPGAPRAVIVIGLDTNQAGALVGAWDTLMGRSPGSIGHVHPGQVRAVTKWVLEASRNDDIVVFAGHHNWGSLGLPTRILLRRLMSNLRHPLVYLSAHTHRGFWAVHTTFDRRPLLELNVSSLSDWPIGYRRISFAYDETAERLLVRGELLPRQGRPVETDADLLAAWEAEVCADLGIGSDALRQEDRFLVMRQRESRGSIVQWALAALGPFCETCEEPLYDHAQAYLDAMLDAVLQLTRDLGNSEHALYEVSLPAWCGDTDFIDCTKALRVRRAEGFADNVALFRRKAMMADLLASHLDQLTSPRAAAYMSCRAVQAAKIDFDVTDDARNSHRGEAKRRAEQFFRVEASVGMQ